MARKVQTITTFVDDLDGTELAEAEGETVKFAYKGVSYEIDLGGKNVAKFDKAIEPFIEAGRKAGRVAGATRASSGRNDPQELAAAREWLRANGHEVSDRGRIPANLLEEYRASK